MWGKTSEGKVPLALNSTENFSSFSSFAVFFSLSANICRATFDGRLGAWKIDPLEDKNGEIGLCENRLMRPDVAGKGKKKVQGEQMVLRDRVGSDDKYYSPRQNPRARATVRLRYQARRSLE